MPVVTAKDIAKMALARERAKKGRFNPFEPSADLISRIQKSVEDSPFGYHGLRVEEKKYNKGDYLPDSRRWDNSEPTEETLNGVSTIGLPDNPKESHISSALSALKPYLGNNLVLVGGNQHEYGEDPGESVIKNGNAVDVYEE
jgi:hypothetical protein